MSRVLKPRAAKVVAPPVRFKTVADLLEQLGGVPPERVCWDPLPGTATKKDLVRLDTATGKLYELVAGTLVEKAMGSPESFLALELARVLGNYLADHDHGFLYGADALMEILPDLVRMPDICFVPWARRPERTVPTDPISDLIPDLVVEILSPTNRPGEIRLKLSEYFRAGVKLVWVIDPRKRSAEVFAGPAAKTALDEAGTLDGADVLPGFRLPLAALFARLAKPAAKKPRKKT